MSKNDIYLSIIGIILLTTLIFLNLYSSRTEKLLIKYAKNQTNIITTKIIDQTIREILINKEYNNIIEIEKDNTNKVTNVNFNNNKINEILSLSTKYLLQNINQSNNKSKIYQIPYGIIYNNHLLSNIGPQIPYMIDSLGNINTNTYINIKEYGINNSMVEIILNVKISFQILLPFISDELEIEKNIILESKIIQGNIPEYYGNVNSLLK